MFCKTTDSRPLCRSPKELSILTISRRYVFSEQSHRFFLDVTFLALHEPQGKSVQHGLRTEGCHKPAPQFLAMPCGMIRGALAALGFAATVHADVINIPACMSALVSPDSSELYPQLHLHHRGQWRTIACGDASAQSPAFSTQYRYLPNTRAAAGNVWLTHNHCSGAPASRITLCLPFIMVHLRHCGAQRWCASRCANC
jgi:hypothetical protein